MADRPRRQSLPRRPRSSAVTTTLPGDLATWAPLRRCCTCTARRTRAGPATPTTARHRRRRPPRRRRPAGLGAQHAAPERDGGHVRRRRRGLLARPPRDRPAGRARPGRPARTFALAVAARHPDLRQPGGGRRRARRRSTPTPSPASLDGAGGDRLTRRRAGRRAGPAGGRPRSLAPMLAPGARATTPWPSSTCWRSPDPVRRAELDAVARRGRRHGGRHRRRGRLGPRRAHPRDRAPAAAARRRPGRPSPARSTSATAATTRAPRRRSALVRRRAPGRRRSTSSTAPATASSSPAGPRPSASPSAPPERAPTAVGAVRRATAMASAIDGGVGEASAARR